MYIRYQEGKTLTRRLYQHLASTIDAYKRCAAKDPKAEWSVRHMDSLEAMIGFLPSGSGFDNGTILDLENSSDTRLVFTTSFHRMNTYGSYSGWTDHSVIVTATLTGFDLRVTGRDREGIKDYIAEAFRNALQLPIMQTADNWILASVDVYSLTAKPFFEPEKLESAQ